MNTAGRRDASRRVMMVVFAAMLVALPLAAHAVGTWERFWSHLIERPEGPLSFRFVLQPVMATITAWRDGRKGAATGRSPYFWTVLTSPGERSSRLREGLRATAKIIAFGLVMDLIYQLIAYQRFFPLEAAAIAILLAFVPYLLLRGPFDRVARWRSARNANQDRGRI